MADNPLAFADIGNALLAGSQAAYYSGRSNRERDAEVRRKEAQQFIEPAVRGDAGAFAKLASADPTTASAVGMALSRMDASTLAKAKAATDYTAGVTTGLLAAPEGERERLYQQTLADAQARGMDTSRWPKTYDPAWVQMQHGYGIGAKTWFEQQQQNQRSNGDQPVRLAPLGGSPAPAGGGGQYGGAIASIESAGAPNGGYGAVGPPADAKGSRAYGKYQVMDFNVGPWTQEILGKAMTPPEFAANPQAQDAVFNGKFGQYVQKYGSPEAAARAWFAGEGGMNNPNAADVNGMTVANYGRKFSGALGQPSPGGPGPAAMPQPPTGLVPNVTMAQMPGAPTNLIPSGPPMAPMPQVGSIPPGTIAPPQIAQGDTPQADASGTPMPPQGPPGIRVVPEQALAPETLSLRETVRSLRPGWGIMLSGKTRQPAYDSQGRLHVYGPNGEEDYIQIPKPEAAPTGYRAAPGGALAPIPGGPADPTTQRRERVPPGYRLNATGEGLEFIPGGPADPSITKRSAPMNNEQARDAGFADRMTVSNGLLSTLDTQGTDTWGRLTEMAGKGGNFAQSPQYQEFRQAKADFINAQLRRESGAAISPDEFKKADEQYFPQPGDKPSVIAQKAKNRQLAVEGMIRGAGPSYQPSPSVTAEPPKKNEQPPAAPAPAAPPAGGKLSMPRLSPADAAKLPPGTPFVGEDGIPRVRN